MSGGSEYFLPMMDLAGTVLNSFRVMSAVNLILIEPNLVVTEAIRRNLCFSLELNRSRNFEIVTLKT